MGSFGSAQVQLAEGPSRRRDGVPVRAAIEDSNTRLLEPEDRVFVQAVFPSVKADVPPAPAPRAAHRAGSPRRPARRPDKVIEAPKEAPAWSWLDSWRASSVQLPPVVAVKT